MNTAYASEPSSLKQVRLSNKAHEHIGRIIRAFAEIEDCVNLYICGLAQISESKMIVMLGRTPLSKKLEMSFYLAKITGTAITELHKELFNAGFSQASKVRNSVAHGVYLGQTEDGRFAFLTMETAEPEGASAIQLVQSFELNDLKHWARLAEDCIPILEKRLKLSTLRQKRYGKSLLPHRKGLTQQQRGQKPRNQPQS